MTGTPVLPGFLPGSTAAGAVVVTCSFQIGVRPSEVRQCDWRARERGEEGGGRKKGSVPDVLLAHSPFQKPRCPRPHSPCRPPPFPCHPLFFSAFSGVSLLDAWRDLWTSRSPARRPGAVVRRVVVTLAGWCSPCIVYWAGLPTRTELERTPPAGPTNPFCWSGGAAPPLLSSSLTR